MDSIGITQQCIDVLIYDGDSVEEDETFTVNVVLSTRLNSTVVFTNNVTTVTILDIDRESMYNVIGWYIKKH